MYPSIETLFRREGGHQIMEIQAIQSDNAPAAIGPYVHAVRAGDLLFVSGQLGLDPISGTLAEPVAIQADQSLKNVAAILSSAGLTQRNIVKVTIFLTDMNDFPTVNEIYGRFFGDQFPARSCVAVKGLPKGAKIEMECIAAF